MTKMNRFTKMNILILLLLVPIFVLYTYSYRTNVDVLQNQIQLFRLNQLAFLENQIETNVDQLAMMSNVMVKDPNIKELRDLDLYGNYINVLRLKQTISEKLNLQSVANAFSNSISVYATTVGQAVGQYSAIRYDGAELQRQAKPNWEYANKEFVKYTFDPITATDLLKNASLVIKVTFSSDNIAKMLDDFHSNNKGEAFFYKPGYEPIVRNSGSSGQISQMIRLLNKELLTDQGHKIVHLDKQDYLINSIYIKDLNGYLIDYISLREIISPVTEKRNVFYLFIGMMLLISFLTSYLLYRNFQRPIRQLSQGVQRLKKGDYSVRIMSNSSNEFGFLFHRFNEMAEEIENLIDKVYTEKLRSRDAILKQLQSQINPHFLYNCLAFIKSMAILGDTKAIVEMANNLGKYYRYTTRNEDQLTTISKDVEWAANYLNIQNLSMQRIQYKVDIPSVMNAIEIPRLLIQPVVENAIVHGLELKLGAGTIHILGELDEEEYRIMVEDDGIGLPEEKLEALKIKLSQPLTEEVGCGLWNVNQRLIYRFGPASGIALSQSPLGGLRVTLHWARVKALEEPE